MYPILLDYIKHYPHLQPTDLLKFCYQSVFGPGHMAPGREKAEARIAAELASAGLPKDDQPMVVQLEGDAARLDIGCGISPMALAALFCRTADRWPQKPDGVSEVLAMLKDREVRTVLPFAEDELDACIAAWQEKGCPAVSHSDHYKSHYRANYRLVDKKYLPYLEAIKAIENLKKPAVVAIDGRCGSGKSTMAQVLAEVFCASLVRMDDFFLPFEQKTPERLAQPGGNVHYERFNEEVAPNLRGGKDFEYNVFDCSIGRLNGTQPVEKNDLIIVEGSYCQSPDVQFDYDLRIFVDIDPETQIARIAKRDPDMIDNFRTRWIPMEEHYFSAFGIKEKADIVVRT